MVWQWVRVKLGLGSGSDPTQTCDHEQLFELLQDLDLEHGGQARDVCQGVLDDVQSIQALLRAHQHDLERGEGQGPDSLCRDWLCNTYAV